MFCNQCGRQLTPQDAFCPTCGRKVTPDTSSNQAFQSKPIVSQSGAGGSIRTAAQFVLIFNLAVLVLLVIAIAMTDRISIVLSIAIELILFFGAYLPFRSGSKGSALYICIGCAAVVALIGVYAILSGAVLIGLLDFAAAAMGFVAWNIANKH